MKKKRNHRNENMMIRYHLYSNELPKEEPKSKPVVEPMAPKKQQETKPMTEKPITVPKAEPVEQKHRPSQTR